MDESPDHYYDRYTITQPRAQSGIRYTKTFVFGILTIALLLGFTLGLYSSNSFTATGSSVSLYDEDLVTELFEQTSPAVVEITVRRNASNRLRFPRTGTGSGFLIDGDGHIVTNNHVVENADEISVKLSNGQTVPATRLGTSPADDLAILQIDSARTTGIEPLILADSSSVKPGQMAIAIGSPFRNFNSVTVGVVSGTGRGPTSTIQRPIPDMIQTDAALNPGNSGGPLINSKGEVIGVNSAVRTGTFQGLGDYRIGFAVPSNTVRSLIPALLVSEEVRRPWLGISGMAIDATIAGDIGVSEGILVTRVFSGSPAEKAGMVASLSLQRPGDIIISVDGNPVSSVEDMVSYFNSVKPGHYTRLVVIRNGKSLELGVTLEKWPDNT